MKFSEFLVNEIEKEYMRVAESDPSYFKELSLYKYYLTKEVKESGETFGTMSAFGLLVKRGNKYIRKYADFDGMNYRKKTDEFLSVIKAVEQVIEFIRCKCKEFENK